MKCVQFKQSPSTCPPLMHFSGYVVSGGKDPELGVFMFLAPQSGQSPESLVRESHWTSFQQQALKSWLISAGRMTDKDVPLCSYRT